MTWLSHPAIDEHLVETMNKSIEYFVEATGYRRIIVLATLAVISALLTQFATIDPWNILRVTWLHGDELAAPILPGIYFGAALAVAAYVWKRNSLFTAGIIVVGTAIAWIVAWECAFRTISHLEEFRKSATDPLLGAGKPPITFFLSAGVVGGFVGGFLTLVGISLAVPEFRTINNWSRTLLVASVAGMLLAIDNNWSPLFIVWQVAVAASIALGWSFQETLKVASRSGTKSKR